MWLDSELLIQLARVHLRDANAYIYEFLIDCFLCALSLFILSTMAEVFDGDTASTMMASVVANKQRLTRKEYRDQKNI